MKDSYYEIKIIINLKSSFVEKNISSKKKTTTPMRRKQVQTYEPLLKIHFKRNLFLGISMVQV